jgi:hypothetical protein
MRAGHRKKGVPAALWKGDPWAEAAALPDMIEGARSKRACQAPSKKACIDQVNINLPGQNIWLILLLNVKIFSIVIWDQQRYDKARISPPSRWFDSHQTRSNLGHDQADGE